MRLQFVALTKTTIPKAFIERWFKIVSRELSKAKQKLPNAELTLVFVDRKKMRSLNKKFRGKDYATDVLSFEGEDKSIFGELVFCVPVLEAQAKEHGLSYREELGYMFLHGILHLLGYEHEQGGRKAEKMYRLQDVIFDKIDKV